MGGEGATPYEVLLHAAMVGEATRFTRQDGVEQTWRIMQPLLDAPPPVHVYEPGRGARPRPTGSSRATAAGTSPGSTRERALGGAALQQRLVEAHCWVAWSRGKLAESATRPATA